MAGSRLDLVRSERLSAADAALTFPALRQGSDDYNAKASQCSRIARSGSELCARGSGLRGEIGRRTRGRTVILPRE